MKNIMPTVSPFSTSPATSSASRLPAATRRYIISANFKKVKVNGDDADPLFKYLKEQKGFAGWDMNHPIAHILDEMLTKADPNYKDNPDIKWNFTKFLIDKRGLVVARFEPTTSIDEIEKKIIELL